MHKKDGRCFCHNILVIVTKQFWTALGNFPTLSSLQGTGISIFCVSPLFHVCFPANFCLHTPCHDPTCRGCHMCGAATAGFGATPGLEEGPESQRERDLGRLGERATKATKWTKWTHRSWRVALLAWRDAAGWDCRAARWAPTVVAGLVVWYFGRLRRTSQLLHASTASWTGFLFYSSHATGPSCSCRNTSTDPTCKSGGLSQSKQKLVRAFAAEAQGFAESTGLSGAITTGWLSNFGLGRVVCESWTVFSERGSALGAASGFATACSCATNLPSPAETSSQNPEKCRWSAGRRCGGDPIGLSTKVSATPSTPAQHLGQGPQGVLDATPDAAVEEIHFETQKQWLEQLFGCGSSCQRCSCKDPSFLSSSLEQRLELLLGTAVQTS